MAKSPRVALVSIDPVWEDPSGDFTPFTYGVRKLEASILSDPTLSDVEVRVIDLRTRDPEAFFEAVVDFGPTLVGASTYLWSIGPFRDLAARIKRWDPSVQVIVGMPCAAAHARWCSLRAEPIPLSLLPGRAAAIILPASSSGVLIGVASSGSRLRVCFSPTML